MLFDIDSLMPRKRKVADAAAGSSSQTTHGKRARTESPKDMIKRAVLNGDHVLLEEAITKIKEEATLERSNHAAQL